MKKIIIWFILCGFLFSFMAAKFLLATNRTIHYGGIKGFAVDASETLYIGFARSIDVYHDGELLRTIDPMTHRDYSFIVENDRLIIGYPDSSEISSVFDLRGKYLGECEMNYLKVKEIAAARRVFEQNEKQFRINYFHGIKPFEIICGNDVVYKMATIDFIFNGLPLFLITTVFFVCYLFLILSIITDEKAQAFFRFKR